jgi:hypothetical protein
MATLPSRQGPSRSRMVKQIWLVFVERLYAVLDHAENRGLEQYLTFKQAVLALITDKRFVDQLASFIDPANEDIAGHGEDGIAGSGEHIARALTEALKGATSDLGDLELKVSKSPFREKWAVQRRTALARASMAVGGLRGVVDIINGKNAYSRSGLTLLESLIEIHRTGAADK